jgi:hypothetical protein
MDVAGLVHLELDLTCLDLPDGPADVERDGPDLGVRHEPAGSQDLPEPPDLAHEIRGRDRGVELEPATLDPLDQVLGADHVRSGLARFPLLLALREDDHAH